MSYNELEQQIDSAYDQGRFIRSEERRAFEQEEIQNIRSGMHKLAVWISLSVGFFLVVISAMHGYSQEREMYQYDSRKGFIIERASELSRGGGCGTIVKRAFEEMEQPSLN